MVVAGNPFTGCVYRDTGSGVVSEWVAFECRRCDTAACDGVNCLRPVGKTPGRWIMLLGLPDRMGICPGCDQRKSIRAHYANIPACARRSEQLFWERTSSSLDTLSNGTKNSLALWVGVTNRD